MNDFNERISNIYNTTKNEKCVQNYFTIYEGRLDDPRLFHSSIFYFFLSAAKILLGRLHRASSSSTFSSPFSTTLISAFSFVFSCSVWRSCRR